MERQELIKRLENAIIDGEEERATEVAHEILKAGIDPIEAINLGAVKGLDAIGERFQRLDAFLPELIRSGIAMKGCMAVFTGAIGTERKSELISGKVVIGTVSGDIHDIGKNLVATMLTVKGFQVYDLGINVPSKEFVKKAEEVNANVIALSALLAQTAYYQQEVIRYLVDSGLRSKYYVIVGGAPVSGEWAGEIGADGYGKTAVDAAQLIRKLMADGGPPPLTNPLIFE